MEVAILALCGKQEFEAEVLARRWSLSRSFRSSCDPEERQLTGEWPLGETFRILLLGVDSVLKLDYFRIVEHFASNYSLRQRYAVNKIL